MLFVCVVQHTVVHQPWTRFLLFSLLSCDGSLRPAALQLLTLVTHTLTHTQIHTCTFCWLIQVCVCVQLVRFSGSISRWKTEVQSVCEEVERRGVTDLTDHSKHTLSTMLTQVCNTHTPI